jgi:superfamily II helicase
MQDRIKKLIKKYEDMDNFLKVLKNSFDSSATPVRYDDIGIDFNNTVSLIVADLKLLAKDYEDDCK